MIGKISFLTLLFALCANPSRAQLDDLHYIPPMHSFDPVIDIGDHVLYISTPETAPVNYTIEDGAGNVLQAGTVSNAVPVTYSLTGTNTDFDVLEADLNTVLPDRGLIVTASDSVYANIRMRGGSSQAASITAKGRVAAGNDFRIFTAPLQVANSYRNHVVGLMATQNGTVVNIDLTGTGVTLHGVGAPATTNVITLNMNAGDSYVFGASSQTDPDNLTGMIGRRITSNNPIVVNSGSWTGSSVGGGGQDIIIDQMAPSSALGQEFVTVKGLGINDQEGTMVIGNINNTDIFINGSATPIATINAGDYFLIDGTNYINGALYVETSSPAYVWQVILGSNSTATQGGIFVPSLSCYSPTGVDLIPDIEMIGGTTFSGGVNIVTLAGATVTINGTPIATAPVAVTGSIYEYYQVLGLTGDVSVQSTESCAVAFFGASGAIGYGGYFSGFSDVVLNLGADGLLNPNGSSYCLDSTALIDVNTDYAIQWLLDDIAIPGANSDTLIPTVAGYYSVEISSPGGLCTDTTNQVFVVDDLAPTASNPPPVNIQCIGDVPLPDINVVTDEADFCTTYPTVAFVSDVSDGLTCPETITRTYSVTDNSGNSINVAQTITVYDNILPTASNPAPVNVQCIGDVPAPDVTVVTDEADNCTL
ncbi:MAG: IgGFc-binding protein, partial [Flavobacteriales bacterium]|nr:IgGFc-binding protein [Flavobacteriales bacterium]